MENQHRKITGYRELSQEEIDQMNKVKALGIQIGDLCDSMPTTTDALACNCADRLAKGLMALTRSIAKPEFF